LKEFAWDCVVALAVGMAALEHSTNILSYFLLKLFE